MTIDLQQIMSFFWSFQAVAVGGTRDKPENVCVGTVDYATVVIVHVWVQNLAEKKPKYLFPTNRQPFMPLTKKKTRQIQHCQWEDIIKAILSLHIDVLKHEKLLNGRIYFLSGWLISFYLGILRLLSFCGK